LSRKRSLRVDALAVRLRADVVGDGARELSGLSSLADAGPSDITFYSDLRYRKMLESTRAGALITQEPIAELDIPQIVHPDPFLAFLELVDEFFPAPPADGHRHPLAHVSDSASLGDDVTVMPFAYIGDEVSIGARSVIHPGVVVETQARIGADCTLGSNVVVRERCRIGSRVILQPGCVIGGDGFGFARRDGKFIKVRHVGIVDIEDDVEIGANAAIDRATLGRTLIHRGVKIDNLVHIAHNVELGEDSAMAAQAGVSGSTVIGKRVLMGGQVGVVDHLSIGDDAILIAQSGVIGNVPAGAMVSGYPARPHKEVLKSTAEVRALSALRKRVRALEKQIHALQEKAANDD
jgi:UDP-3-O-[3-hydroxymyristoyl] glucosamine N-acyltransferase